jgi:hypothetical protein
MAKPKQVLSKLQRELKKIFKKGGQGVTLLPLITELRKLGPLFTPPPPPGKAKPASQQQPPKQPHAKRGQVCQAVLAKKAGYAQNGSDFIGAADGRGVYKSFGHLTGFRSAKVIAETKDTCSFPDPLKLQNFNPGAKMKGGKKAGQQHPYPWRAHHLIPGSSLYLEKTKGQPCFSVAAYEILLQSTYDINNGHNIINLPGTENYTVFIHCLLAHPSDHRNYTTWVMNGLKEISDEIEKLQKEGEDHDDIVKNCLEELEALEGDGWDKIVDLSKATVGVKLAGKKVTDGEFNKGLRLI